MGKQWKQWKTLFIYLFILGVSKITADGDSHHKIKRCLVLGRKAMTNIHRVLKSRDIHHFTDKGSYTQSYGFFPVVMYGCESWTTKKAEHQRTEAFELRCWEDSWESFDQQGDQTSQSWRKSTLNTLWKDWGKESTHWKRPWSWERLKAGGEGDSRG